jgi:hypothetical protein
MAGWDNWVRCPREFDDIGLVWRFNIETTLVHVAISKAKLRRLPPTLLENCKTSSLDGTT